MKWNKTWPKYGTLRTRSVFCWYPHTYGNYGRHQTTYWLESVIVEEEWVRGRVADFWSVLSHREANNGN